MGSEKLKIAFNFESVSFAWMGGVNYFCSLLHALKGCHHSDRIAIVVFIPIGWNEELKAQFPQGIDFIESRWLTPKSAMWFLRKITLKVTGTDYFFERLLVKHGCELLSHGFLGRSKIPSAPWIPDFQDCYYPSFFNKRTITKRRETVHKYLKWADAILLSSESALADLQKFYSGKERHKTKFHVIRFVPRNDSVFAINDDLLASDKLNLVGLGIIRNFILISNQFWQHKNHDVVFSALTSMDDLDMDIVCTGSLNDERNTSYADDLLKKHQQHIASGRLKIMGKVNHATLISLMRNCQAYVNPSYFEGWNTGVEEAKYNQIRIAASDIPVHQEQLKNYNRKVFFDPTSPISVAHAIRMLVSGRYDSDSAPAVSSMKERLDNYTKAQNQFACDYLKVVSELIVQKRNLER